ncbi:hypothetical protein Aple_022610 [Acrocarpospora pleiomorpha]|uniref:AtuA-like ferredoxin-fold domain-containing protein n=2 Tax=Acrocarpospora pleiomorpha TaxID=90975 RepID=A0A5M3XCH4_9ACTN|nr:hypothetical protein Aple_022610 [Acrocarpospora pleiomorpha]
MATGRGSVDVPLYRLAQARSGDKNDTSDITVFFPNAELFRLCDEQLSADAVRAFLAPLVLGSVDRYVIPNLFAYKFVCHAALGGGGSSSLRSDNLGKSMASALLRMAVRNVPAGLAESSPLFAGPPKKDVA